MIKTEHLTKHYGALTAVEDVSFQVGPAKCVPICSPTAFDLPVIRMGLLGKSTGYRMTRVGRGRA